MREQEKKEKKGASAKSMQSHNLGETVGVATGSTKQRKIQKKNLMRPHEQRVRASHPMNHLPDRPKWCEQCWRQAQQLEKQQMENPNTESEVSEEISRSERKFDEEKREKTLPCERRSDEVLNRGEPLRTFPFGFIKNIVQMPTRGWMRGKLQMIRHENIQFEIEASKNSPQISTHKEECRAGWKHNQKNELENTNERREREEENTVKGWQGNKANKLTKIRKQIVHQKREETAETRLKSRKTKTKSVMEKNSNERSIPRNERKRPKKKKELRESAVSAPTHEEGEISREEKQHHPSSSSFFSIAARRTEFLPKNLRTSLHSCWEDFSSNSLSLFESILASLIFSLERMISTPVLSSGCIRQMVFDFFFAPFFSLFVLFASFTLFHFFFDLAILCPFIFSPSFLAVSRSKSSQSNRANYRTKTNCQYRGNSKSAISVCLIFLHALAFSSFRCLFIFQFGTFFLAVPRLYSKFQPCLIRWSDFRSRNACNSAQWGCCRWIFKQYSVIQMQNYLVNHVSNKRWTLFAFFSFLST